jgi:hypothetical protein
MDQPLWLVMMGAMMPQAPAPLISGVWSLAR